MLIVSSLLVCAMTPLLGTVTFTSVPDDLFVVVSVLLIGTVAVALVGLDAGTAFGGMGSSRHMTIAALVEPTVLVSVYALSIPVGSSVLSQIVEARLDDPASVVSPVSLLALLALAVAVVAETGRLPVDNPSTHLELTMVHEAMVLESSGRDLAWLELGSWLRLGALLGLLSTLLMPWGIATELSAGGLLLALRRSGGQARDRRSPSRRGRGLPGEAAAVPRPRAAGRVVRAGLPRGDRLLPRGAGLADVRRPSTPS